MEKEIRTFDGSVEYREEADKPIVGYAAVFNRMSENLGGFREVILPGAFDKVLGGDVRGLINHDANLLLGRTKSGTMSLTVDDNGLRYDIKPGNHSYTKDLIEAIKRGDIDQSSFAFTVDEDDWSEDDDGRVTRTIKRVKKLYDVSAVTYPAYPDSTVGLKRMEEWRSATEHQEQVIDDVVETPEVTEDDNSEFIRDLADKYEKVLREEK